MASSQGLLPARPQGAACRASSSSRSRRSPSATLDGRTGSATPYTASIPLTGTFNLNGHDSQVYDVSVTLNYHDQAGKPGPMAAFVDMDKLMVYA